MTYQINYFHRSLIRCDLDYLSENLSKLTHMIGERSTMTNIFEIDDDKLIEKFVQGSNQLLASANLRLEVNGAVSQLLSRTGDTIAIMYLQNKPRTVIIKQNSPFLEIIDRLLIERDFVMFGSASRTGFVEYKHYVTPAGYRIWYTDPSILWKKWWPTERFQNKQRFNMEILVSFKDNWYPVQNIILNGGIYTIKTIAGQLVLQRNDKELWLAQIMQEPGSLPPAQPATIPTTADRLSVKDAQVKSTVSEFNSQASSADLAKKIQQKQSTINSDQARTIIKDLEQKLQTQVQINAEMQEKLNREGHRATIAEQRLQIVYKYLQQIGISPRDIYNPKSSIDN